MEEICRMEEKWKPIQTEVETVNDQGEPLHLSGVKALQHVETRQIVVSPDDIAQAEVMAIARDHDLEEARDVAPFLILFARPSEGMIPEGDIQYKYHLQKSLFYLWKGLEEAGMYEMMPRDDFIGAKNGPLPVHLDQDLQRFSEQGFIDIQLKDWHTEFARPMKHIKLTAEGFNLAKNLWVDIPEDYSSMALWAKKLVYPMHPLQLRELVHKKYPEFIDDNVNDIE